MAETKQAISVEGEIRDVLDKWVESNYDKDLDRRTANYASGVRIFGAVGPLETTGSEAARKRVTEWFASFDGPVSYEIRDLEVVAGEEVAFCHSLNHMFGNGADGKLIDMWARSTLGLRKVDGRWLVTHEHMSLPFDVKTEKVSLDIKPETKEK